MNSLSIFRALLRYTQSDASPILRRRAVAPGTSLMSSGGSLLMILVFVSFALTSIIATAAPGFLIQYRDTIASFVLIAGGLILSVIWIAPVAALAAYGVREEQISGAWAVLRLTNIPREELPLIKVAAMVRGMWLVIIGIASFGAALTAIMVVPVTIYFSTAGIFTLVYVVFGVVVTLIEHVQEITLATSIGVAAGEFTRSVVLGLIGGLMIRVATVLLLLLILPSVIPIAPDLAFIPREITASVWLAACALSGSAALIAVMPGIPTVLLAVALIFVREALTRTLMSRVIRHSA